MSKSGGRKLSVAEQVEKESPVRRDEDRCSECLLCVSACPFEAISVDEEGAPNIDTEECMVCGICGGVCPSKAIEIDYYNIDSLLDYVEQEREEKETDNLIVACRGSYPLSKDIEEIMDQYNIDFDDFVDIRLPCLGRMDPEFYVGALSDGIERVVMLKCDEEFCRFEDGSAINTRWSALLSQLLDQFGYDENALTVLRNPMKAVYETTDCVGCQKCEYICPFDAVEAEGLATPEIDFEACEGCGACSILCSEFAIQVEGYEHETLRSDLQEFKKKAEEKKPEQSPVLVFSCQWAEFSNLDNPENGFITDDVAVVEIPCYTSLDPTLVIDALESFDGVMVAACADDDCKMEEGRDIADRNSLVLEKTLDKLGMGDRFEVFYTSPREIGKFKSKIDSFTSKIAQKESE